MGCVFNSLREQVFDAILSLEEWCMGSSTARKTEHFEMKKGSNGLAGVSSHRVKESIKSDCYLAI
jgi:hypothetical protein